MKNKRHNRVFSLHIYNSKKKIKFLIMDTKGNKEYKIASTLSELGSRIKQKCEHKKNVWG